MELIIFNLFHKLFKSLIKSDRAFFYLYAMQELFNSIEYLKGVGPKRAELLRKELGIHTLVIYYTIFHLDILTKLNSIKQMR